MKNKPYIANASFSRPLMFLCSIALASLSTIPLNATTLSYEKNRSSSLENEIALADSLYQDAELKLELLNSNQELSQKIKDEQKKRKLLEEQLLSEKNSYNSLREKLKQAAYALTVLKKENASLKDVLQENQQQSNEQQRTADLLEQRIDGLHQDLLKERSLLEALEEKLSFHQQNHIAYENQNSSLLDQIAERDAFEELHKKNLSYLEEKIVELNQELSHSKAAMETLLAQAGESEQKNIAALFSLTSALEEKSASEKEYNENIASLKEKIEDLQHEVLHYQVSMQALLAKSSEDEQKHTSSLATLTATLEEKNESEKKYNENLSLLEGKIETLHQELFDSKASIKDLLGKVNDSEEQGTAALTSLAYTHDLLGFYQTLFTQRDWRLEQLNAILNNAGYRIDTLNGNLNELEHYLANANKISQELNQAHGYIADLQNKSEILENELAQSHQEIASAEELFHSALNAHASLAIEFEGQRKKLQNSEKIIAELEQSKRNSPKQKQYPKIGVVLD